MEAVVLPIATWALHQHLKGRDIVWLIDNEAAAACGIRGSAKLPEVEVAVQAAHLLWLHLGCRVWIEWTDSKSSPADGLSRQGLADPWTQDQQWDLTTPRLPPWPRILLRPTCCSKPSGMTLGIAVGL